VSQVGVFRDFDIIQRAGSHTYLSKSFEKAGMYLKMPPFPI